jgi:hypothetical protein
MEIAIDQLDRDQRSCLLYLECRAVDYDGVIDDRQMNETDWANIERWSKSGLLQTRIRGDGNRRGYNHVVKLSPTAWNLAHALRIERAGRADPAIWGD